jgi:NAD-dependent dihydropyrimidine dehydrogenase PreA subunit
MTDQTNWLPRIDQSLCTGCGDCIIQCPTGALGWRDGKADLLHSELCLYCATCEDICPVRAIELPFLITRVQQDETQNE